MRKRPLYPVRVSSSPWRRWEEPKGGRHVFAPFGGTVSAFARTDGWVVEVRADRFAPSCPGFRFRVRLRSVAANPHAGGDRVCRGDVLGQCDGDGPCFELLDASGRAVSYGPDGWEVL